MFCEGVVPVASDVVNIFVKIAAISSAHSLRIIYVEILSGPFHIGAFCFDARQFGAFHFGDFHFDAVPVRRVSLWRASTSARFSLARFHFGAFLFGAFPNFVSKLMHNRLCDHLFPFCACFLRRSVVYASFAAKPLYQAYFRVSLCACFYLMRHIFY